MGNISSLLLNENLLFIFSCNCTFLAENTKILLANYDLLFPNFIDKDASVSAPMYVSLSNQNQSFSMGNPLPTPTLFLSIKLSTKLLSKTITHNKDCKSQYHDNAARDSKPSTTSSKSWMCNLHPFECSLNLSRSISWGLSITDSI
jgi:hypothetical protein